MMDTQGRRNRPEVTRWRQEASSTSDGAALRSRSLQSSKTIGDRPRLFFHENVVCPLLFHPIVSSKPPQTQKSRHPQLSRKNISWGYLRVCPLLFSNLFGPDPTLFRSGLTLLRPGLTQLRSRLTLFRPGLTLFRPDPTLFRSGLTLLRPGLTLFRRRSGFACRIPAH